MVLLESPRGLINVSGTQLYGRMRLNPTILNNQYMASCFNATAAEKGDWLVFWNNANVPQTSAWRDENVVCTVPGSLFYGWGPSRGDLSAALGPSYKKPRIQGRRGVDVRPVDVHARVRGWERCCARMDSPCSPVPRHRKAWRAHAPDNGSEPNHQAAIATWGDSPMIPTSSVRLLCAAPSCAAFGLSQYFRVAEAGEPGNELAWNSPRMLELKKDWDALASLVESKGNYARAVDLQGELLRRRFSDEDLRRLAASCRSLDASADYRDPFSNFVLVFIVKVFVNSEDWNNLTKLLSTRFPRYVGMHDYIESYLARHGSSRMRPILLLGDAYSGCRDPLVRYEIAGAPRRGFAGFGIRAEEDEDFVRKAMRWYGKEKGNLVVNPPTTAPTRHATSLTFTSTRRNTIRVCQAII